MWDKTSPLGMRASQGGSKTFILMIGSGKRRTLGRFGILSLSRARDEARLILAEKTQDQRTSGENGQAIFRSSSHIHLRASHEQEAAHEARSQPVAYHWISNTAEISVRKNDVIADLKKLAETPSEQLHAFRALRVFFKWCMRPSHRYMKHSPLEGYRAPSKDEKGKRILSDAELCKVWHACDGTLGDMVRLLILWDAATERLAGYSARGASATRTRFQSITMVV